MDTVPRLLFALWLGAATAIAPPPADAEPPRAMLCVDFGCAGEDSEGCSAAPERFRLAWTPATEPVIVHGTRAIPADALELREGHPIVIGTRPLKTPLPGWGDGPVRLVIQNDGLALTVERLAADGTVLAETQGQCGYEPRWRR